MKNVAKMNAGKLVIGEVRFSYARVFEPAPEDAKINAGKYSVQILLPKENTEAVELIKTYFEETKAKGVKEKWGGKKCPASYTSILRDGDGERPNGGEYGAECKGHWVMSAKTATKPPIVANRNGMFVQLTADEFFSGCYGLVSLIFFPYDQAGKKGIGVALSSIVKTRGSQKDRLDLGANPETEFAGIEVECEDTDYSMEDEEDILE